MSATIQPFVWRHFCVENPTITANINISRGGYINIDRTTRIQGANPVNQFELLLRGTQGGFLCKHITMTTPSQGTLQYTGTGWFYKPNPTAHIIVPLPGNPKPPDDTFTFKLTYFGQDSLVATVNVLFQI